MPKGKTHRNKKLRKRADFARRLAQMELTNGISIGEIMRQAGVSYATAQQELRLEQVERALAGESVSGASRANGFTKMVDDTDEAVLAWMIQAAKTIRTYTNREAIIAQGHTSRASLSPAMQALIDLFIFVDLAWNHAGSAISAAEAELDAIRNP